MANAITPKTPLAVNDNVVYTTPQGVQITNCVVTRLLSDGISARVLCLDNKQSYSGLLTQLRKSE